jgi:hypothetical protein
MFKHFKEKWRLWEEAFLGMDDLQGDHLLSLEKRVARLEDALEVGGDRWPASPKYDENAGLRTSPHD